MKKEIIFTGLIIVIILAFALLLNGSYAQSAPEVHELLKGKNNVTFQKTAFASDIIKNNPEIEAISYYDERAQKTIGYINHFKGIGRNFLITPSESYEVISKANSTLII